MTVMDPDLTFNAEAHQYAWKGRPTPSVSEILRVTGQSKDWGGVPGFYRDRGQAVHLAINLFVRDELDEDSLDPVIIPYFKQFREWSDQNGSGILMSEAPMYSRKMDYAGTVDMIHNQSIYDIKCSKKLDKDSQWQYQLQGAAYKTLVRENMDLDFPFKVLLLTGEGPAQVIPLLSPYTAWEAVVHLFNVKCGRGNA